MKRKHCNRAVLVCRLFGAFVLLVLLTAALFPVTVNARIITADDEMRTAYEKLISCGVVPKPFYAQRLWTEQTVAEAIDHSNYQTLDQHKDHCSSEDIEMLRQRIQDIISQNPGILKPRQEDHTASLRFHNLQSNYQYISGGTSAFPNNNRGTITAVRNPLMDYEHGRLQDVGHNFFSAAEQSLYWRDLEIFVRPEWDLWVNDGEGQISSTRIRFDEGYGLFNGKHINLVLGRAPVIGGQGEYGGFLFTENARALDHFWITNAQPVHLPWFLSHLGEYKFSFIFGNLGPEQEHAYTFFSGLGIAYKPASWLEINLSHLIEFGGENSTEISLGQWAQEFFGFIPFISQSANRGANKITEADLRFFIDPWMGLQGYVEYSCDDSNVGSLRAFEKHFTQNSSWRFGLYFTRLFGSLSDSFRTQFTITAPIAYRHSEFADGWTEEGNIIGDPLGPDGKRFDLFWTHDWSSFESPWSTTLRAAWEMTDNYFYVLPDGLTVDTTTLGPTEKRYLVGVTQKFDFDIVKLKVEAAYLYRVDANYAEGATANDVRLGALVEVPFGR